MKPAMRKMQILLQKWDSMEITSEALLFRLAQIVVAVDRQERRSDDTEK
jgi:hypothetical protein